MQSSNTLHEKDCQLCIIAAMFRRKLRYRVVVSSHHDVDRVSTAVLPWNHLMLIERWK